MPILALLPFFCISKNSYVCGQIFFAGSHLLRRQNRSVITTRKWGLRRLCFHKVFVCPGWGLCPGGVSVWGLCPGVSVQEGSLSKGSLCPGGVSFQGESLSRGVSVRETPHTVTYGRYASYWNAFLFLDWYEKVVLIPMVEYMGFYIFGNASD